MLVSRLLARDSEAILYHYCSAQTLLAIAEYRTIRYSDANMMNDHDEGRYSYRLFEQAANSILKDETVHEKLPEMDRTFFDKVDEILAPQQLRLHPIIACFSKKPDVLSQWRAYADNGRGFALGIAAKTLQEMPCTLLDVEYDPKQQLAEMKAALIAIAMKDRDAAEPFGSGFREDCRLLGWWGYGFKDPHFAEEQEVRCLHLLDVVTENDRPRLVDRGGRQLGKRRCRH